MNLCNQKNKNNMYKKQIKIQSLLDEISIMNAKRENLKNYIYKSLCELDLEMPIISLQTDNYLQGQKDAFESVLKKLFRLTEIVVIEGKEEK